MPSSRHFSMIERDSITLSLRTLAASRKPTPSSPTFSSDTTSRTSPPALATLSLSTFAPFCRRTTRTARFCRLKRKRRRLSSSCCSIEAFTSRLGPSVRLLRSHVRRVLIAYADKYHQSGWFRLTFTVCEDVMQIGLDRIAQALGLDGAAQPKMPATPVRPRSGVAVSDVADELGALSVGCLACMC